MKNTINKCLECFYLGNFLKVDYYVADVVYQADYFPLGMMTSWDDAGANFRYGFQGYEKVDETVNQKRDENNNLYENTATNTYQRYIWAIEIPTELR